jgi:chemotaxis signal transduction protein
VNILRLDKELGFECKKENTQSIFIEYKKHIVAFIVHDIDNIVYLNEEDISEASATQESLINGAIIYNNEVIVKLNAQYIASLS